MTWPPTPVGASGIRDFSDVGIDSRRRLGRDLAFRQIEGRFSSTPALRALVGRKLTRLRVENVDVKDAPSPECRYHYFDRASNATSTVVEPLQGPVRLQSPPASEYQPEITQEEIDEATALAKRHFQRQGVARVARLQGFGIQAYRPEGNGFYDGRVIYDSLHADSDSDPEYTALIDLTRQKVFNARKEIAK